MEAFERWVGRPYNESLLELGYLWPVKENWNAGDRLGDSPFTPAASP